jgi:hypothetical protein
MGRAWRRKWMISLAKIECCTSRQNMMEVGETSVGPSVGRSVLWMRGGAVRAVKNEVELADDAKTFHW